MGADDGHAAHPVRGVHTIQEELDKARNDNTYRNAFGSLGIGAVFAVLAVFGYTVLNTIYVWCWIFAGLGLIGGVVMLIFGKSMEDDRHRRIAELEAELAEARAAQAGGTPPPASDSPTPARTTPAVPMPASPVPMPTAMPQPASRVPLPDDVSAAATHGPTTTSPARDRRFCGHCGARIARDTAFCTQCGARTN